jgi:predicted phosphate transport protein (TIGR00153 family)
LNFGFFSPGKKERKIFDGILGLLDIVSECVESFAAGVAAYSKGDTRSAQGSEAKVFDSETKADAARRYLSFMVAEGAFFGGVREDILNLMERIDDIADSAKDAIRILAHDSRLGDEDKAFLASEGMNLFMSDLKSASSALRDLVTALKVGRNEALAMIQKVEDYEEEADTHKDALLKELFNRAGGMSPLTVIQLRDFIFTADDIADNAEDAGDVILILLAKGYG